MKNSRRITAFDVQIGQRIKQARTEASLTQQALAEKIGTSFQMLQKYENGLNRVGAARLWEIAKATNTPIQFFFTTGSLSTSSDKCVNAACNECILNVWCDLPPHLKESTFYLIQTMQAELDKNS